MSFTMQIYTYFFNRKAFNIKIRKILTNIARDIAGCQDVTENEKKVTMVSFLCLEDVEATLF